jgi:hypothetical protein
MEQLIKDTLCSHTAPDLARGYLRYEALRKLTPHGYAQLNERNIKGERFDDMVE